MEGRGLKVVMVGLSILAVAAAGCATQSAGGPDTGSSGNWFSRFLQGGSGSGDSSESGDSGALTVAGRSGARGQGAVRDPMGRPAPTAFVPRRELKDIHFEFDRAEIRPEAAQTLDETAAWLRDNPQFIVLIEGHADERGTNEYNVALGDRRAKSAMNYLVAQGVQARRFSIVSYGEERPLCAARSEDCWTRNRRAHFAVLNQ